jgi:hypothetical protein
MHGEMGPVYKILLREGHLGVLDVEGRMAINVDMQRT